MSGGNYFGAMLVHDYDPSYFIMEVYRQVKLYAYGHEYRDSGGYSGGDASFEKWNGKQYEEYKTVPTKCTGERYELVTLEKGRYKVQSKGTPNTYVNFDEWEIERIQ